MIVDEHRIQENEPLQNPPGKEATLDPQPAFEYREKGSGRLKNKVAIITGADSGIGRAVAIAFAHEGADIVCAYLSEKTDAEKTKGLVEKIGQRCELFEGDLADQKNCVSLINFAIKSYSKLDILVNNAAEQTVKDSVEEITAEQLDNTFKTNIYSYFYLVQEAVKHLPKGSCIINTTSVTAYRGSDHLIDYSATKGAIVTFTRSLALSLAPDIRVNAVAPGPVWTPLISSTFPQKELNNFGKDTPLKRPGQPNEIAPAYVFLASSDASYITGQVIHPNGGEVINT